MNVREFGAGPLDVSHSIATDEEFGWNLFCWIRKYSKKENQKLHPTDRQLVESKKKDKRVIGSHKYTKLVSTSNKDFWLRCI